MISVIIPTYNEKENVGRLVEHLVTRIFPKIDKKYQMMNGKI